MTERSYFGVHDKTGWGEGPWHDEPDKAQWIDAVTGLDCLIVRNHFGAWCGYVGVPPGHPWYGRYQNGDTDVDVHGGLTFAASCDDGADEESGICHIPEPGRPAKVWWFGFDCGHFRDLTPGLRAREREMGWQPLEPHAVYRDLAYVREEVASLAEQLAGVHTNVG